MEGEEVGALLPLDVDHLDELAGAHLVGEGGRRVDADVEPRLGERRRELLLLVGARRHAPHLDEELGGRRSAVDDAAGRRGDDDGHRALGAERLRRARRRPLAEEPDRERLRRVEAARAELVREQAPVAIGQRRRESRSPARPPSRRAPLRRRARPRRARRPRRPGCRACRRRSSARPARGRTRSRRPAGRGTSRRTGPPGGGPGRGPVSRCCSRHALAGAFASISAASAMSFSASSRLPSASSFFTSFSTARRLYDWFQ